MIQPEKNPDVARMGQRIKDLRAHAGLTQAHLATRWGLKTPDTVSRLELGLADGITLTHLLSLARLAHRHGISADELLLGRKLGDSTPDEYPNVPPSWYATATLPELVVALAGPVQEVHMLESQLKYVNDPDIRRSMVEALYPGAFDSIAAAAVPAPLNRKAAGLRAAFADGTPAAEPDVAEAPHEAPAAEPPAAEAPAATPQPPPGAPAPTPQPPAEPDAAEPDAHWRVTQIVEPGYVLIDCEQLASLDDPRDAVPLIGRIAAGDGVDTVQADEMPVGTADAYIIYAGAPETAFAVRVVGDSMEPDYRCGDVVLVDGAQPVRSGICCVIYRRDGGDRLARLKRLAIRGPKAYLRSLNPRSKTLTVPADHIEAYAVVDHLHRFVQRR